MAACLGASLIAGGIGRSASLRRCGAGLACGLVNGVLVSYARIPPFIATYGMLWIAHGMGYVFMKGEVIYGLPAGFRSIGAGFVGADSGAGADRARRCCSRSCTSCCIAPCSARALYAIGGNPWPRGFPACPCSGGLVIVYAL